MAGPGCRGSILARAAIIASLFCFKTLDVASMVAWTMLEPILAIAVVIKSMGSICSRGNCSPLCIGGGWGRGLVLLPG